MNLKTFSSEWLERVATGSQWFILIAAFVLALTGIVNFLANQEKGRRSDLRVARNEKATAQARLVAAQATREASLAQEKGAELNERANELQLRSAELEHRTAGAELETARLQRSIAWRFISDEAAERIQTLLAHHHGQRFELFTADEREARSLARNLDVLLQRAGWLHRPPVGDAPIAPELDAAIVLHVGLAVVVAPGSPTTRAARALSDALNAAGLPTRLDQHAQFDARPDTIGLFVGSKPPTD